MTCGFILFNRFGESVASCFGSNLCKSCCVVWNSKRRRYHAWVYIWICVCVCVSVCRWWEMGWLCVWESVCVCVCADDEKWDDCVFRGGMYCVCSWICVWLKRNGIYVFVYHVPSGISARIWPHFVRTAGVDDQTQLCRVPESLFI